MRLVKVNSKTYHHYFCLLSAIVILVLLLGSPFAFGPVSSAAAATGEIPTSPVPKPISGTYVNLAAGLKIVLPPGWSGNEITSNGAIMAVVARGGLMIEGDELEMIILNMVDRTPSDSGPPPIPPIPISFNKSDCKEQASSATVKISNVKAAETTMECPLNDGSAIRIKTDSLQTDKKWISATYFAKPASSFDKNVGDFDDSIRTLTVQNAIDMTENAGISLGNLIQSVKLASGSNVDLVIQSSSNVSDFAFSEPDKKISFRVSGQDGTEGATTIVSVSRLLKGPYAVLFDGQAVTNFETFTNQTTGDVSIELKYHHSNHEVNITGTQVVPEFPATIALGTMATAGMIVVAVGLLVTLSKWRRGIFFRT